ncbi:MAG TPA: DUF2520 domain-containing protein [Flavihumibacter sp.]|jgi:predicted short-subunit dehydrogenase-like oxidoreductase (DUF2520 family)
MKIVLIGSGNVAQTLGEAFRQAGHQIIQVMSRTRAHAENLAGRLGAKGTDQYAEIDRSADLYVVALTDTAIPGLALKWRSDNKLVVHTAGTVPMAALHGVSDRIGVLYPLQSLKGAAPASGEIPFLVQASREADLLLLKKLAETIGSDCQVVTDRQRLHMHVSAVWVNNFPNLMYSIAYRLCQDHKLNFELLLPLIRETTARLEAGEGEITDPFSFQTGPAMREDQSTILRHLELLNPHPDWKDLYEHLSEEIVSLKSQ